MGTETVNAWLLNFAADEELARPTGPRSSPEMIARIETLVARVGPLVPKGDVVLLKGTAPHPLSFETKTRGIAFCPTPRAIATLKIAGAAPIESPPFEIIRRVNNRRFNGRLGQTLPEAAFVATASGVEERVLASPTRMWLMKRPYGFAGRGRRKITRVVSRDDRAWIDATLREWDGLQIEPWVERVADFALHGFISPRGVVTFGEPTRQECSDDGAWIATFRATSKELDEAHRVTLARAANEVAEALRAEGYFGPFNVDAFTWRDADGRTHFNERCEINARYSMGWATGMGERRPDLDE